MSSIDTIHFGERGPLTKNEPFKSGMVGIQPSGIRTGLQRQCDGKIMGSTWRHLRAMTRYAADPLIHVHVRFTKRNLCCHPIHFKFLLCKLSLARVIMY